MGDPRHIDLQRVREPSQWAQARALLQHYLDTLTLDLSRRDLASELADLPRHFGGHGSPAQALWLATVDGAAVACGGLRPLPSEVEPNACEMKRLFVEPSVRGLGLGRRLAEVLIEQALAAGYSAIYLDTLSDMAAARGLYESLGFEPVEPWMHDPAPGANHFRLDLDRPALRF